MQIPLALIADYANVAQGGKLNIMGVFDRFWSEDFPATLNQLYVVLRMDVEPAEYNSEKAIELKLLDADGKQKMAISGKVRIGQPDSGGRVQELSHLLRLTNLSFEAPGDYEFVALINGDPKAHLRLIVALKEAKREQQSA